MAIFYFILALSMLSATASAGDLVFYVSQAPESLEMVPGESQEAVNTFAQLKQILKVSDPSSVSVRHLQLKDPYQLKKAIDAEVKPQDRILGIIFQGHGDRYGYNLDAHASLDGAQMAYLVHNALIRHPSASRLFVYVAACSCGREEGPGENMQTEFLNYFRELEGRSPKWDEVHMIAHQDFGTSHPVALKRSYGKFEELFYNSKIARTLYHWDVTIFNVAGRSVLHAGSFLKALPVALLVAAFADPGTSHFHAAWANQLIVLGAVEFAVSGLSIWLENSRSSWVQIKTLSQDIVSKGEQSTIYSALRRMVSGSRSLRCETMFR
jgi:hypothetical protein